MKRNDMQTPTSNISHTHAQTVTFVEIIGHRWKSTLTMGRDAGKHDMKLCTVGVIDLAKEFIICNVPCKEFYVKL